ncbi:hypothetical protein [Clostridium perfringens]|uniref:hypothetical protein n=1 Tax=Clostridium perfringens TaxID=1502 RepID=UPI00096A9BEF|nr:hypothetical protein [Clostridium perfringens]
MEREKIQEALNINFKSFDYKITMAFYDITRKRAIKKVNKFIKNYIGFSKSCKYIFVIADYGKTLIARIFITNIKEIEEIPDYKERVEIIRKKNGSFGNLAIYFENDFDVIGGYSEGFFEDEKL